MGRWQYRHSCKWQKYVLCLENEVSGDDGYCGGEEDCIKKAKVAS